MIRPYLALFLFLVGPAWAQERARLYLVPQSEVISAGDTLELRVEVDAQGLSLTSASVFLSLDPNFFAPLSEAPFAPGPFLPGQVYENSAARAGALWLGYVVVGGAEGNGERLVASGAGELARLRVQAMAPGETQVRVQGTGARRSIYTERGRPGVERRFQVPLPLVIRVEGGGPIAPAPAPVVEQRPAPVPVNAPPEITALEPLAVAVGGERPGPLLAAVVRDGDDALETLRMEVEGDSVAAARIEAGHIVVRGLRAGQGQVALRVRDPRGGQASAVLRVEVRVAGESPLLRALPRLRMAVGQEQALFLEGYASDLDTPAEDLRFAVAASGGVEAWLEGRELHLRGTAPGPARIDLQVADPEGNTAAAALAVEVEEREEEPVPTAVEALPPAPEAVPPRVYPNPFNAQAAIRYGVSRAGPVRVRICDLQGRQLRLLADQVQEQGIWIAWWDGRGADGQEAASGVYFYVVEAGGRRWAGKLSLVR